MMALYNIFLKLHGFVSCIAQHLPYPKPQPLVYLSHAVEQNHKSELMSSFEDLQLKRLVAASPDQPAQHAQPLGGKPSQAAREALSSAPIGELRQHGGLKGH